MRITVKDAIENKKNLMIIQMDTDLWNMSCVIYGTAYSTTTDDLQYIHCWESDGSVTKEQLDYDWYRGEKENAKLWAYKASIKLIKKANSLK